MEKIRFQPEPANGFYITLKNRVQEHFAERGISRYSTAETIAKSILFTVLFSGCYIIILTVRMPVVFFLATWFLMGVFILLAAMSVVHDAAHGVYSSRPWVNELLLRFANLVGADGYMYKYKHTVSHHPYTNIHGIDIDLEQSGIVKVTPFTQSQKKHKYQAIYMKAFYPFFILFWVLLRDFSYYRKEQIGLVKAHHAPIHWFVLISSKLFYLCYMLVAPAVILDESFFVILAGFLLMHIGSGIVAMFALLANHVVEDSVFVTPDKDGLIPFSWGEHQLRTTNDYSPDSRIISYLFSGLNHHVAHHLFPRYCHVHYPAITKIVRNTAEEFGLRYRYNLLFPALQSHFRLLKNLAKMKQEYPLADPPHSFKKECADFSIEQ